MKLWVAVLLVSLAAVAAHAAPAEAGGESSAAGWAAQATILPAVRLYQTVLSPFMITRCRMVPHCSAYAVEAVQKHGALLGWFMAVDRLIHEADELDHGVPVFVEGRGSCVYDPVHDNDFWWSPADRRIPSKDAKRIAETLLP